MTHHTNTEKLKAAIDSATARYVSCDSTRDELYKEHEAAFHEFYASCGEDWPNLFHTNTDKTVVVAED